MTVTNTGLAEVANLLIGDGTAFGWIAIGTGTNNDDPELKTALQTEVQRESATTSRKASTGGVTNAAGEWVSTFSFSGAVAVTEAGLLNAATDGVLLARQVFSAVNMVDGDSLEVTISVDCE